MIQNFRTIVSEILQPYRIGVSEIKYPLHNWVSEKIQHYSMGVSQIIKILQNRVSKILEPALALLRLIILKTIIVRNDKAANGDRRLSWL